MRYLAALNSRFSSSLMNRKLDRCCPCNFGLHILFFNDRSPLQLDADMDKKILSAMRTFEKHCSYLFSFSSNNMLSSVLVDCVSLYVLGYKHACKAVKTVIVHTESILGNPSYIFLYFICCSLDVTSS